MAKGGESQTTQTTNSDPWSAAQPFLKDVLGQAQSQFNTGQGFGAAPFSPQTSSALGGIEGMAGQGNPLGAAAQNSALGIFGSGGLTQPQQQAAGNLQPYASGANVNGGSPEFLHALDYQAGKTADDVNRTWSNAGRYGSMGQANDLVSQVGGMRDSAMAQEQAREQGLQMQANGMLGNIGAQGAGTMATFSGLAPSIYDQQFSPFGKMAGVGATYDAANQQNQQAPWSRLGAYAGLVNGMGGQGGTTSTSVPKPGPWQGAAGGALSGASMGSMVMPGWGTAIGAGLGGLLGYMG